MAASKWNKEQIKRENGEIVMAQTPEIVSASRATDIPAFFSDWFVHRLNKGYLKWMNPFNGKPLYVSFRKTRLIVFWSKNPKPLMKHLPWLDEHYPNYYFQYTLNDYDSTLEKNIAPLDQRIDTFIKLSERIGKEKVIWRFDPFILTQDHGVDELLKKVEYIGNQLHGYTEKLVFSFADIEHYKKVQNNMRKAGIPYQEFTIQTMQEIASGLQALNRKWQFSLASCAEKIDLSKYGVIHNKCIDDDLIIRLFSHDKPLMKFLGYNPPDQQLNIFDEAAANKERPYLKDKGQRQFCGCIISKDIGQYNTCPHLCTYCYANVSENAVLDNYQLFKKNKSGESII